MPRSPFAIVGILALLAGVNGCAVIRWVTNTQPIVRFTPGDYSAPETIVGPEAVVYRPPAASMETRGGDRGDRLLRAHAPILVQGLEPAASAGYERSADLIGRPSLTRDGDRYRVRVDTTDPRVYTRIDDTLVRGELRTQLVYSYWYPRHPVGGIQEGEVDGGIVRITLDAGDSPLVYEFVHPCGCYHSVFVPVEVERRARAEHASKVAGKRLHIERDVPERIDWAVRDLVVGSREHPRPVVFLGAGAHGCVALQTEALVSGLERYGAMEYALAPHEDLDRLPIAEAADETAPLYDPQGLVWGGRRWGEEWIFTSMEHPGWPRRFEKIRIHWDEASFTDESLIDTYLRLPRTPSDPGPRGTPEILPLAGRAFVDPGASEKDL